MQITEHTTAAGHKYYLKEGPRQVALQVSYAARWAITWAHIFVDCMSCTQSIGIKFADGDMYMGEFNDKEAANLFREHGWIIEPGKRILCQACQKNQEEPPQ